MRHPAIARQIKEQGNLFSVLVELFRRTGVDACFVCGSGPAESTAMSEALKSVSHGAIETRVSPRVPSVVQVRYTGRFAKNELKWFDWPAESDMA
jgi:hypothetical protein